MTRGRSTLAVLLVRWLRLLCSRSAGGYLKLSVATLSWEPRRCWNSMMMWRMMTRMIMIMKKRSHTSASFISADLGSESKMEERREANTRNPVMPPMNLLEESTTFRGSFQNEYCEY